MSMSQVEEIHDVLRDMIDILESVGETWWAGKAKAALEEKRPDVLVREVASWFGGMGSINDLMFAPDNGHQGAENVLDYQGLRFRGCRKRLFDLCGV